MFYSLGFTFGEIFWRPAGDFAIKNLGYLNPTQPVLFIFSTFSSAIKALIHTLSTAGFLGKL